MNKTKNNLNLLNYLSAGLAFALLSSCSIKPEVMTPAEMSKSTKDTLSKLHVNNDNEIVQINLKQAIAIALERNLDYRVARIQNALAYKQFDLAKLDMSPKINTNFAYNHRNKDVIKNLSGVNPSSLQSLTPRTTRTMNISFNWAAVDFGLGYMRARQAGDRYLEVQEQRKLQTAKIINEVIKNYILSYYGQELTKKIVNLEKLVNSTFDNIDKEIEQKIGDRLQLLNLKKDLMSNYQTINGYLVTFNQARQNLLKQLNYHAKGKLETPQVKLEAPGEYLSKLPTIKSPLMELDTVAIYYRPELSQAIYKIHETEKQKLVSVIERLPGFGFTFGYNYDSDKYNVFKNWLSDNMNIAWNLLNMAVIPASLDTVETQIEAAKLTHLASSAVVLGEIRILLFNYRMKLYDYSFAEKTSKYSMDVHKQNQALVNSKMLDKQSLALSELTSFSSDLQRIKTFIDARTTLEDLLLTLGLYHSKGSFTDKDYVDTVAINKWIDNFSANNLDEILKKEANQINNLDSLAAKTLTDIKNTEKEVPASKSSVYLSSDDEVLKRPATSTQTDDQANPDVEDAGQ